MTESTNAPALPSKGDKLYIGFAAVEVIESFYNKFLNASQVFVMNLTTQRPELYSPADLTSEPVLYVAIRDDGATTAEANLPDRIRGNAELEGKPAMIVKVSRGEDRLAAEVVHVRDLIKDEPTTEEGATA